jgi:nitroreductase
MAMDVAEAIRSRRSIRAFTDAGVSREQVAELLGAGKSAPSAGNLQARDFFVISSQGVKDSLARIEPYGARGRELYCLQDAAAAVQNMLLAAHSMGLACCWVGAFDESQVHEILKLPGHLRPVAIVPVGHPAERGRGPPKRSDDVHWL